MFHIQVFFNLWYYVLSIVYNSPIDVVPNICYFCYCRERRRASLKCLQLQRSNDKPRFVPVAFGIVLNWNMLTVVSSCMHVYVYVACD